MSQNLSSAAVVIGALRVNCFPTCHKWVIGCCAPCCSFHTWLVDRVKFASLEANLVGVGAFIVYPILFSLSLSGRSPNMTKILLTETLSLNSIKPPGHNFCHLLSRLLMFSDSQYCKQYQTAPLGAV